MSRPPRHAPLPPPGAAGPSGYADAYWGLGTKPTGAPIVTEDGLRVAPNANGNWTLSWPRGFTRSLDAWPDVGAVLRARSGTWTARVEGIYVRNPRGRAEADLRVLTA